MQVLSRIFRAISGVFGLFFLCFLSACSVFDSAPPEDPIVLEPVVEEPVEPEIPLIPAPVDPTPDPIVPAPLPEPPTVAIALSSRQPAYEAVALELSKLLEEYAIYDLSDRSQPPVTAFRLINDSDAGVVVAIGLRAARSSLAMSDTPVVFSQVFNYQQHALLSDSSRGVSSLAPLTAHLSAWKELDPEITSIGAIIGEGHDDLIAEAREAAERHDVELEIQVVRSDQEALYHFRRMVRDIDGFWLFPDNRILSTRSLSAILEQANQRRVPVAVTHEPLLEMGATLSVSAVAEDIARTIVGVIREIEAGRLDQIPQITPLSEARIVIGESTGQTRTASRADD